MTNANDLAVQRAGYIIKYVVCNVRVVFVIKSGAYILRINENIQQQFGLPVVSEHEVKLAEGSNKMLNMVTGVEVQVFHRRTLTDALLLPGDAEPLSGSIPKEALNVLIDPAPGHLTIAARPYIAQTVLL